MNPDKVFDFSLEAFKINPVLAIILVFGLISMLVLFLVILRIIKVNESHSSSNKGLANAVNTIAVALEGLKTIIMPLIYQRGGGKANGDDKKI